MAPRSRYTRLTIHRTTTTERTVCGSSRESTAAPWSSTTKTSSPKTVTMNSRSVLVRIPAMLARRGRGGRDRSCPVTSSSNRCHCGYRSEQTTKRPRGDSPSWSRTQLMSVSEPKTDTILSMRWVFLNSCFSWFRSQDSGCTWLFTRAQESKHRRRMWPLSLGAGAEVSCPNIFFSAYPKFKWFCPNITCSLGSKMATWKKKNRGGGGGGLQPPGPRLVFLFQESYIQSELFP